MDLRIPNRESECDGALPPVLARGFQRVTAGLTKLPAAPTSAVRLQPCKRQDGERHNSLSELCDTITAQSQRANLHPQQRDSASLCATSSYRGRPPCHKRAMEPTDAEIFSHTFLLGGEADLPTLRAIRGPEAETRKKRAHRKSRWGCIACKRRKVKVRKVSFTASYFFSSLSFFLVSPFSVALQNMLRTLGLVPMSSHTLSPSLYPCPYHAPTNPLRATT